MTAALLTAFFIGGWIGAPSLTGQELTGVDGRRANLRGHRLRTDPGSDAPEIAAGAGVTTGNQIAYNGGSVLLGTTNVYYIWYGDWDANSMDILNNLAVNIGGSPYFNINTGYFDGLGRSVSNSVSLAGVIYDFYSRGVSLTSRDIWLIVSSALTQGALPIDPNGTYFVLTTPDVTLPNFTTKFCGWHTTQVFNGTNIHFSFVGNSSGPSLFSCAAQSNSPNGNPGADGMASVVAHELEEMVTDPDLDAWHDSSDQENADKCAWTFGTTYATLNGSRANMQLGGMDYLIQQNWANAAGGYCALTYTPGADFALSPTVSQQTVVAGDATGSYSVSVIPVLGFSGSVDFSVSGLPAGATASILPSSSAGGNFNISTLGTLPGGTYPFIIAGTSGSLTRTAAATMVVSGASVSAAALSIGIISPEPSQVGQTYTVGYSVSSATGTPAADVTVTDGSATCTGTVATGSCALASTTPGTKIISVAFAGDAQFAPITKTRLHTVTSGGTFAHFAAGSGWQTTLALVNLGTVAASATLNFDDDSGTALNLPLTLPDGSGAPKMPLPMPSNSMLLLNTIGPAEHAFSAGWTELSTGGPIGGYEMLRYAPSGQEAMLPLETRRASSYILVFDNTSLVNALGTGVALANLSTQIGNVSIIIRNEAGVRIASGLIPLAPMAHTAFVLSAQYPASVGKRGTMELFTPPGGQISVTALRSNGSSFTPIPAIVRDSESRGGMAHVVFGAGWQTIFYLVNTGTSTAIISLSFFDDNGNPLPLPLTFLQNGSLLTAAQVTKTLAAGASLAIQAQGLNGQAAAGSAQFTTIGNASGFALLRYDPSGQEAAIPLQSGNAGTYVVPFDHSGILKLGIAIANMSAQAADVGVILRDDAGALLQTGTLSVAGNGHSAFVLDGSYPVTAGKRGTVEFDPTGGAQITVVGIRANGNFFTSVPVLTK